MSKKDLYEKGNFRKSSDNISIEMRKALKDLKNDDSIVLRRFDKGNGWVLDDRSGYESKTEDDLLDSSTFLDVPENKNLIAGIHQKGSVHI